MKYYLNSESGNDSNDGSQDNPWKTLKHALVYTTKDDELEFIGTFQALGQGVISENQFKSRQLYRSYILDHEGHVKVVGVVNNYGTYLPQGLIDRDGEYKHCGYLSEEGVFH